MQTTTQIDDLVGPVRAYFMQMQSSICEALETADGTAEFSLESIAADNGGLSQPRVLAAGDVIEKAAVQFTHSLGDALPPAATARNPHLAGAPFQAVAISLIVHPVNPKAPTTHMNLRFFVVNADQPVWYFGGGYDLTPFYGYKEDAIHWHQTAARACAEHYPTLKAQCDEYFYLTHRKESRGIGGIFFDDWTVGGFEKSFTFAKNVGDTFLEAYLPILNRRKTEPYSDAERNFQLYRRGRYAEFNLAIDRGTKYGLQSGRRIESVLASLPPLARWEYNYVAPAGSREEKLTSYYLIARDWLAEIETPGSGQ